MTFIRRLLKSKTEVRQTLHNGTGHPGCDLLLRDDELRQAYERYKLYRPPELSYATVGDYCDSMDHLRNLAIINHDLKDVQRPWLFKAVLGNIKPGAKLIEIGAGEPHVANLLARMGYEVWVVDPYDGCGNGPTEYEHFKNKYPGIHFLRQYFSDSASGLDPGAFDGIYSISVLEHIPLEAIQGVFKGIRRFLRTHGGLTIHAIDHVHRGAGADGHLGKLQTIMTELEISHSTLQKIISDLEDDPETYFLSAYGHNLWRGNKPYADFPMRRCVSINICKSITAENE